MDHRYALLWLCGLLCTTTALILEPSETPITSVVLEDYDTTILPGRSECGVVKETNKIYGGNRVQLGEFPWIVGLQYKSVVDRELSNILKCSGSLINKRWILTAANCVSTSHLIPVNVVLGDWNLQSDPDCVNNECAEPVKNIAIQTIVKHPNYDKKTGENDIALIRLDQDVIYTEFISPVCLPPKNLPFPALGKSVTVAGWGKTEQEKLSNILLKVELPITSSEDCAVKLKRNITRNRFCAGGEEGKDTCQGDSGSPAIRIYEDETNEARWYQYGIVSLGANCGLAGYSAIYTSVDQYMDWIVSTIRTT